MHWNAWLDSLQLLDPSQSGTPPNRGRDYVHGLIKQSNREIFAIADIRNGVAAGSSPSDGAELCALAVYDDGQWNELLYRAIDYGKIDGWPGRAPWLWPIAGRCYATSATMIPHNQADDCSWEWDGVVRAIPRHGFARHQAWHPTPPVVTSDKVISAAELSADGSYQESYPFDYHLTTIHRLSDKGFGITFRVEASTENATPMPFALGLHFTLDFSSWWGDDWLQGSVRDLGRYAWQTDKRAQSSDRIDLPSDSVLLSDPLLSSALVPARAGKQVSLVSPDGERALEMSFSETAKLADGDLAWVTFADPRGRFFCLEPWVGWPNAINSGRGRVILRPGDAWEFRVQLNVRTSRSALRQVLSTPDQETIHSI